MINLFFDPAEMAILEKHGKTLQQLMEGTRIPKTPLQKHFVSVCKGEGKAITVFEKVWLKYIQQVEYEAKHKRSSSQPSRKTIKDVIQTRQEASKAKTTEFPIHYLPRVGLVIYDKEAQGGLPDSRIRLWKVLEKRMASFDKNIFRQKCVKYEQHIKITGKQFQREIDKALFAYKAWRARRRVTHCFECQRNLVDYGHNACKECGWINCKCGACGCNYYSKLPRYSYR